MTDHDLKVLGCVTLGAVAMMVITFTVYAIKSK
jgi:hypothetical protein